MIRIDLRQLPIEGKVVEGEISGDVFDLSSNDNARPESPLHYRLKVRRSGDFLHLDGVIEALFSLDCGRCLEPYKLSIKKDEYRVEIPIENDDIIDLTDRLREDILLDLPGYPRCEDGNVDVRDCPAKGEFEIRESGDNPQGRLDEADDKSVWGALDDIDIKP